MMASPRLQQLNGKLDLQFQYRRGKTRMTECLQEPPLKASRVLYTDHPQRATVYLVETSGGMVGGDEHSISVTVDPNAQVELIPQAATKVYPVRIPLQKTKQVIKMEIKDYGSLLWKPETLIPFINTRFQQRVTVSLTASSTFFYGDILAPGRTHHDERFLYQMLDNRFELFLDGQLIAFDRIKLEPLESDISKMGMLDDYAYLGSAWFSPPPSIDFEQMKQKLHPPNENTTRFALTELEGGIFHARCLSHSNQEIKQVMLDLYEVFLSLTQQKRVVFENNALSNHS
ncbi:urease accessory protein UreD [Halalkalibacterium ligniniphilum]|uniref:urease accessory protein UreD n=1 Tax=Halalkalibacterium ligniniphilum TaxID=1134413 RepID=UPI00034492D5|nr:urease accessory protein UreD [Halalkalibacterium ligniniphilum]